MLKQDLKGPLEAYSLSQQRAVVKKIDGAPSKNRNSRAKRTSLTFAVKQDLAGTCELLFEGSMTKPFLASHRFAINAPASNPIERALIDLTDVKHIDDAGIDFLLRLMKKIDREGVLFQLIYDDGEVGSKIESSGIASYFAKPTWVYGY